MGKISIHLSKLLKQGYSSRKHQTTFRKFNGRRTDLPCSQICHFCVTYVEGFVRKLWHMTGSQLLFLNESGRVPHVRRKWSLFPEHLISLPLGSSRSCPLMIYTLQNLSVFHPYLCKCKNGSNLDKNFLRSNPKYEQNIIIFMLGGGGFCGALTSNPRLPIFMEVWPYCDSADMYNKGEK